MKLYITNDRWNDFISPLKDRIDIARCISVDSVNDIDMDFLGNHWTTKDHWYSYGQHILDSFPDSVYCIFGNTDKDNIAWDMSKSMFDMFDNEYELYVIDPSKVRNITIYKVNSDCTLGDKVY